jgi:hypothetical protein
MNFADYCRNDAEWKRLKAMEDDARNTLDQAAAVPDELKRARWTRWDQNFDNRRAHQRLLSIRWRSAIGCVCCVPGGKCMHEQLAKGPEE